MSGKIPGRGWAWFGFATGIVASVAGNVAHQFVKFDSPPPGSIVLAALWPLALMLSLEVISRVQWPQSWWWKVLRYAGVGVVAAVAAFISYKHLYGLIRSYGEDEWSSAVGPLAIDGLMAVCSAALLATAKVRRPAEAVAETAEPSQAGQPAEAEPVPAAGRPSARRPKTDAEKRADRIRREAAKPSATTRSVADKLQVDIRTVQRYWPKPATPEQVKQNGHAPVEVLS